MEPKKKFDTFGVHPGVCARRAAIGCIDGGVFGCGLGAKDVADPDRGWMRPYRRKVSALPFEIVATCWLEFELCAIVRILLEGGR